MRFPSDTQTYNYSLASGEKELLRLNKLKQAHYLKQQISDITCWYIISKSPIPKVIKIHSNVGLNQKFLQGYQNIRNHRNYRLKLLIDQFANKHQSQPHKQCQG